MPPDTHFGWSFSLKSAKNPLVRRLAAAAASSGFTFTFQRFNTVGMTGSAGMPGTLAGPCPLTIRLPYLARVVASLTIGTGVIRFGLASGLVILIVVSTTPGRPVKGQS